MFVVPGDSICLVSTFAGRRVVGVMLLVLCRRMVHTSLVVGEGLVVTWGEGLRGDDDG